MDSCAVCEGPGSGIFFGVFTCRPCASFFRRSVRERRQYVCRQQGDCPIDKGSPLQKFLQPLTLLQSNPTLSPPEGMRNCCRACRLRRCLLTGMRAEMANAGKDSSFSSSWSNQRWIGQKVAAAATAKARPRPQKWKTPLLLAAGKKCLRHRPQHSRWPTALEATLWFVLVEVE
jgi:hypothetical protein